MALQAYQIETDGNATLAMACQKAQVFADAERADGTRAVYARAWKQWEAWTATMRTEALPAKPEAVAAWLAELARTGKSVSTISVRLAAILHVHRHHGAPLDADHPAIGSVRAGIERKCTHPVKQARAITFDLLRHVLANISGSDMRAERDRALILTGFWGALRRSEIAAFGLGNARSRVEISEKGAILHVTGSKGRSRTETVAIPRRDDDLCAVKALERYCRLTGIVAGPLFRPISKAGRLLSRPLNAASVAHILAARQAGMPHLSPHGLRAGFATEAARCGLPEHAIARHTRHRSTAVRGYIRQDDVFAECSLGKEPFRSKLPADLTS